MPKNSTGVYKRQDGRYEGQYYGEVNTKTGKRRRISVYGKTSMEAKEKLQKLISEILTGTYIEKSSLTVEMWLIQWLKVYALPKVKQSTYTSYEPYVYKHINPAIGKVKLKDLRVDVLQEFFNSLKSDGRLDNTGGLSPKTVRNIYTMLKTALKQAVQNDLLIKNPIEFVKLPSIEKKEMRVLSKSEQVKLVAELKISNERYAIGILICLFTGIRVGELCGLMWSDLNTNKQELNIRRTLGRLACIDKTKSNTQIVVSSPKSQSSVRTIPVQSFLITQINVHKSKQKAERLKAGEIYDNKEYIICNELGYPIEPRTMQDVFKRILKNANVPSANFHAMRHTFATRGIEMGMDIKTLSDILGHADVSTTLNRYGHSLDEHKRKAMDMMSEFY